jgi:hypothetical protein
MALEGVVAKVLERLEDLDRGAVALRVKQVVDVDEDLLKGLCSCQLLFQHERSGMSYVHACRNGLWDGVDAAEATELLPLTQVSEVAAHVGFPIRIEDFNTPVATLLTSPAHVSSQTMELAVEAGLGFQMLKVFTEPSSSLVAGISMELDGFSLAWPELEGSRTLLVTLSVTKSAPGVAAAIMVPRCFQ